MDRADVQVDLSNVSGVKRVVEHKKRSHEKRSNSKKLLQDYVEERAKIYKARQPGQREKR